MKKKLITTALFILMAWSSFGQILNQIEPGSTSVVEMPLTQLFPQSISPLPSMSMSYVPLEKIPKVYNFKIKGQNKNKTYMVILPDGYDSNLTNKHKVIFFLPGQSTPHFKIEDATKLIKECNNNSIIFITIAQTFKDGNFADIEVDAVFSTLNNTERRRFGVHESSILKDMQMLDIISSKIVDDFKGRDGKTKIDTDRMYICGHSSGAITTQAAAMYLNDKFAAFGSVAGVAHQNISSYNPKHKVPIILFNATDDDRVKYEKGNKNTQVSLNQLYYGHHSARQWYSINGGTKILDKLTNETGLEESKSLINTFTDNMFVNSHKLSQNNKTFFELYKIFGGGHHWHQLDGYSTTNDPFVQQFSPGNIAELPYDKLCQDISTTQLLLDFFNKHTKSGNNANGVNLNTNRATLLQNLNFRFQKSGSRPAVIARIAQNQEEEEIGSALSQSYKIYPTLVEDIVNVELENDSNASYSITLVNMLGQVIENQMLNGIKDEVTKTTFNTVSLSPNLYFIQVEKNGEKIISEKIIKK